MKIRNVSETGRAVNDRRHPPFHVGPGETVEVEDELAESLLQQPDRWEAVPDKTASRGKEK